MLERRELDMDTNIRNFAGTPITVLVGETTLTGELEHVSDSGTIVVNGWRILMSRVSAWTPLGEIDGEAL